MRVYSIRTSTHARSSAERALDVRMHESLPARSEVTVPGEQRPCRNNKITQCTNVLDAGYVHSIRMYAGCSVAWICNYMCGVLFRVTARRGQMHSLVLAFW